MTTISLVLRSMRKNIKMYYLYFFALIVSVGLFFIFSTLQYDSSLDELMESTYFSTAFQVARLLLISITIVFSLYATTIFLSRRSQELGIYQLIGLSKRWVVRVLLLENVILGIGALFTGMVVGVLLSRFFLIILLNLIGVEDIVGLSLSWQATIQTLLIFAVLIVVSSLQIFIKIYRSTLLELFQAEKQHDDIKTRPGLTSGFLAVVGFVLVGYGYYLSTIILDNVDSLLFIMLAVLALTITGTYLIFQTSISWLFHLFRKNKNGHLGLYHSLSIAPLMHRMKGNANSLTLITVLSAMTITMISLSYSLYYSSETDVKMKMPFDFVLEDMESEAEALIEELNDDEIDVTHHKVKMLRFPADFVDSNQNPFTQTAMLLPAEQLLQASLDITIPEDGEAVYYHSSALIEGVDGSFPKDVLYESSEDSVSWKISELIPENAMNFTLYGQQLVVSERTFDRAVQMMKEDNEVEYVTLDTFMLNQTDEREKASPLFMSSFDGDQFIIDYYSIYQEALQQFGLLIFVTGFLGFVFLLSTGSILYFKQMTEAEQEKNHYKTLRQLGFQVHDIMKGIIRKQAIVFLIPLFIGLFHAAFAVNVGSVLVVSNIVMPTIIGMAAYVFIYLLFAVLTINYYSKIVKSSL
ncbi:FtsX-like permease family protein [Aureibacillus halotolerans]|uniref:Bacitracin transport system permease protein n=1 Tax=Aureibacillus halotolerans TaxID=1508390 RepID=A0A4R6TUG5_9BACI|nr:ABC transporter permease [Aureibacillus halotolerans]TDQ37370.1 bacitracin transport system permease protein [Aureibacillus halotolerans]